MAEITLTINGRNYGIACDDGQEQRVLDLGHYLDARLKEIGRSGAASNENHLLVLTALMMADEVFDLRDNVSILGERIEQSRDGQQDELAAAAAIDQLAERIDGIAERIQKA